MRIIIIGSYTFLVLIAGTASGWWARGTMDADFTQFEQSNTIAESKRLPDWTATSTLSTQTVTTEKPKSSPRIDVYEGGRKVRATWYSRDGCLKCSPDLIMANNQPLDDSKYTIAYDALPLDSMAMLCNRSKCVDVTVTDRIGIPRHVDLTRAVWSEFNVPFELGIMDLVIYPNDEFR